MDTIYVKPGETFETVMDGAPSGLTGVVGVRLVDNIGGTPIARTTAGISEVPAGSGAYVAVLTAPLASGQYRALWDTDPGGVATPYNSTSQDVTVATSFALPVLPPSVSGGVCSLWCDPADVVCAPADAVTIEPYVEWASTLLYQLSARRFPGLCSRVLRPCRPGCTHWQPASWGGAVYAWGDGMWNLQGAGQGELGAWDDECGCGISLRHRLPYPTREITEVRIDGVIVDPATYRLDSQQWLTRIAGNGGWPLCQNLELADGAVGTFTVTVTYGAPPPIAGVQAALALSCELYKLSNPAAGECSLPAGVTQIVRNGLTMTKQAVSQWQSHMTGVAAVDAFLAAYNPKSRTGRGRVWSPDTQLPARKVGP